MNAFSGLVRASVLVSSLVIGLPVASITARAEILDMVADLSGINEVPPVDGPAEGYAALQFDTATRTLTWSVEITDLSGPIIGAHIHGPSAPGENGGIVFALETTGEMGLRDDMAVLFDDQVADLLAGRFYLNVHTEKHPGGELRGHIVLATD